MIQSEIIKLDEALAIIGGLANEYGLSPRQEDMFDAVCRSIPVHDLEGDPFVFTDMLKDFVNNFAKAVQTGNSSFLRQERGRCVDHVVDIEEFCESTEYMNQAGYIRPAIKRKLLELFDPDSDFIEAVLTGAIGIGKNYFADLALGYMVYLLSTFHNPQIEYDLAPGSSIIFILQSKSHHLAKKVVFDQFSERLKLSPYFRNHFQFDPNVKSELRFPKNIFVSPVGGDDTSAIGMNVYGGIIDEMNFMARTAGSLRVAYTGEDEYDQAERLYNALIKRMKSRFIEKGGGLPGKLLLVSSTNYPGDFTDRKIEESKKDNTIFIMNMAQWEALPAEKHFSGKTFYVEVGNEVKRSRILNLKSEAVDEEDVVSVPEEYRADFERDLETALRDLGGISTGSKHPFIPQRELIEAAQVAHEINYVEQLFLKESSILSYDLDINSPDWEVLVNLNYLEEGILDQKTAFAVHIDVGLTHDAAGFAIGRITGYKLLPSVMVYDERTDEFTEVRDINAPIYTMDGVLQALAPPGGEVELSLLRDLVLWLKGKINVKWATMDSYQSAMMIQAFRQVGIRSGTLSVDASIAPYTEAKQAVKDERLLLPRHAICSKELRDLERDPKTGKVDHPPGGSKDCSDAVAGSVYMLHRKEARYSSGRGRRRRKGRDRAAVQAEGVRRVRFRRR